MDAPTYPACDLAAALLGKVNHPAGEVLNTLKLNALLYYAEAWSLALFERTLSSDELEAWDSGPMYPALWARLSHRGWNNLLADDLRSEVVLDTETQALLDDIWQAYGEYSLAELEKMIKADAPWKEARRGLQAWDITKRPLSKTSMAGFYKTAMEASEASTSSLRRPESRASLTSAR